MTLVAPGPGLLSVFLLMYSTLVWYLHQRLLPDLLRALCLAEGQVLASSHDYPPVCA